MEELESLILERRKDLKYEFYIPSKESLMQQAVTAASFFLQKEITSLKQCLELSSSELKQVGVRLGIYGNFFRYKYETYYISALTLHMLGKRIFSREEYFENSYHVFLEQKKSGQIIKHPESYSTPCIRNTLQYAENIGLIDAVGGGYQVRDRDMVKKLVGQFANDLLQVYHLNLENSLMDDQ